MHRKVAIFLMSLGVMEYVLFSPSFTYFFQGDALYWMEHRFRSWGEFFRGLYITDSANWYRPLSNRIIPSAFFRWFGLEPYGYHLVIFLLFFLCTCLTFFFLHRLTSSFAAAAAGAVFFALHSINVYITYDFAFAPDLFYASFYILSCLTFLRASQSRRWYGMSLLFFAFALMSKEAAITLPLNLVLLALFMKEHGALSLKWTAPFFALASAYYVYFVQLLKVGAGDYAVGFHKELLSRTFTALYWAVDMPSLRHPAICVFVILALAVACFGAILKPRVAVFGLAWFLIGLAPTLAIIGRFGPYYLFLPLAGIALIIGTGLESIHKTLSAFGSTAANVFIVLLLAPFIAAAATNADIDRRTNTALGYAGNIAAASAKDMKAAKPTAPQGAVFYIVNPEEPDLWRYYGLNSLMRLVYNDDSIDALYSSLGHVVSSDLLTNGRVVAMKYDKGRLADITEAFTRNPQAFTSTQSEKDFQYVESERITLELIPTRIKAGSGAYTIRINGASNTDADVQYHVGDGPLAFLPIHLDARGETRFFVSKDTLPAVYRFVAIRLAGTPDWVRVTGVLEVTP